MIVYPYDLVHHPAFYSEPLLQALPTLLQQAQTHVALERRDPDLRNLPALAALAVDATPLVEELKAALRVGLCEGETRDRVAWHAFEFLQEITDAVLTMRSSDVAINPAQVQRVAQTTLQQAMSVAFNQVFASELGPAQAYPDDFDSPMPDVNEPLTLAQKRRVLSQVFQVTVHHALAHRSGEVVKTVNEA